MKIAFFTVISTRTNQLAQAFTHAASFGSKGNLLAKSNANHPDEAVLFFLVRLSMAKSSEDSILLNTHRAAYLIGRAVQTLCNWHLYGRVPTSITAPEKTNKT